MSEEKPPSEEQVREALRAAPPLTLGSGPVEPVTTAAPEPSEVWPLPLGTAWVYYGEGNSGLTRPVILADGFNSGPSSLNDSWDYLDRRDYAFLTALRQRGRDVILVGFNERSASILDNADAVEAAVMRAVATRLGDARLTVGGFSMGGLVTRYTLARMESRRIDHQTALYVSYDSPHRGAWIPIALQSFAHYIRKLNSAFSDQMNSPAAQQLLWQHIAEWQDQPATSKLRTEFLSALQQVGDWPRIPRLIGVANGVADGTGNGVRPGEPAFEGKGLSVLGSKLFTQSPGDRQLVANLRVVTPPPAKEVRTSGLPGIDGAPGGTLNSFEILANRFNALPPLLGFRSAAPVPSHSFVPAVSAAAVRDLDSDDNLYVDIDSLSPEESELDDFRCASRNEGHTRITEELCTWIMDRLPY
ncbi:esterase/lipase family protein [Streptomyces longispororuber]|uniref:esterase/lipase family protein n=1 Tax=Streptomyces longispororuber TaxID=68230 RepID=UPI0036F80C03